MDREQSLDGFQFDHHLVFDHDVHSVAAIELDRLVHYGQGYFALTAEPRLVKLETKAFHVGRFEQARAQSTVHLDGTANDLLGQKIILDWAVHTDYLIASPPQW